MSKRPALIDHQTIDGSGKLAVVKIVPVKERPVLTSKVSGIPSAVDILSSASGGISAEIAEDLLIGVGTAKGDLISVRFAFGPRAARGLALDDAVERLTALLGESIVIDEHALVWDVLISEDGIAIDLFERSAEIALALGMYDEHDYADIGFTITSYVSELDRTITAMSPEDQKTLALSPDATSDELEAIIRLSEPGIQISAINNPNTDIGLIRQVAENGPPILVADKNGLSAKTNKQIQVAAKTEMARRSRRSKRNG